MAKADFMNRAEGEIEFGQLLSYPPGDHGA
jgi:hypothetical protein